MTEKVVEYPVAKRSEVCYMLSMKHGEELPLEDAMRLKSAELWLEVQQPLNALKELLRVTESGWEHPWTVKLFKVLAASILAVH